VSSQVDLTVEWWWLCFSFPHHPILNNCQPRFPGNQQSKQLICEPQVVRLSRFCFIERRRWRHRRGDLPGLMLSKRQERHEHLWIRHHHCHDVYEPSSTRDEQATNDAWRALTWEIICSSEDREWLLRTPLSTWVDRVVLASSRSLGTGMTPARFRTKYTHSCSNNTKLKLCSERSGTYIAEEHFDPSEHQVFAISNKSSFDFFKKTFWKTYNTFKIWKSQAKGLVGLKRLQGHPMSSDPELYIWPWAKSMKFHKQKHYIILISKHFEFFKSDQNLLSYCWLKFTVFPFNFCPYFLWV